jgi:hypothetical protein
MSGMNQRINVSLPQNVHRALRVYCVERRLTMAEVIIEALTQTFAPAVATPASKARPPT